MQVQRVLKFFQEDRKLQAWEARALQHSAAMPPCPPPIMDGDQGTAIEASPPPKLFALTEEEVVFHALRVAAVRCTVVPCQREALTVVVSD